jgi:hypothetical protein
MSGNTGRVTALAATLLAATLMTGCTSLTAESRGAPSKPTSTSTSDPYVVRFEGLRDITFGQSSADLTSRGIVTTGEQACGPRMSGVPEASPVFADGKLVLLWFNPPYATPEGVKVGTPVSEVRAKYGNAVDLEPPAGSYTFPGLLVIKGDRAYLFLHDGKTVLKTIAGYESYARKLYETGFGSC